MCPIAVGHLKSTSFQFVELKLVYFSSLAWVQASS